MLALTAGSPIQRLNGTFSQLADSRPVLVQRQLESSQVD